MMSQSTRFTTILVLAVSMSIFSWVAVLQYSLLDNGAEGDNLLSNFPQWTQSYL